MLHTIDEIAQEQVGLLQPDDVVNLRKMAKDDMIAYHNGWGTAIRNEHLLWYENDLTKHWRECEDEREVRDGVDCSSDHPDTVSMRILERVWELVQV